MTNTEALRMAIALRDHFRQTGDEDCEQTAQNLVKTLQPRRSRFYPGMWKPEPCNTREALAMWKRHGEQAMCVDPDYPEADCKCHECARIRRLKALKERRAA